MKLWVVLSDEDCVGSGFFQGAFTNNTAAELDCLERNEKEAARAKQFGCRQTTSFYVEETEVRP